jgi:hypothetical protein
VHLSGSFRVLFLYDVAEAIDLAKLQQLLGPRGGTTKEKFPRRTPDYVRFEQPPILEPIEHISLPTREQVICSVKYYSFAAVVVQFDVPFECQWEELKGQASRWVNPTEFEPQARAVLREHLERIQEAIIKPRKEWLAEDYLIINLQGCDLTEDEVNSFPDSELTELSMRRQHSVREHRGRALRENPAQIQNRQRRGHTHRPTADELVRLKGREIAQIIQGESTPLAERTTEEILSASASYFASDLTVIGSSAAFVYDRPEDAAATSQVLEYAKVQLLEFRYYDGFMTQLISDVYAALEVRRNVLLSRWSFSRQAQRFNTIRLDVMELTERIDNAIKFVSDVYYARVYRLAATRMGVHDYRNLVDEKLRTVGELYDFMTDQFNEARSFVVELGIAILALLDVIFLLRGFGGFGK